MPPPMVCPFVQRHHEANTIESTLKPQSSAQSTVQPLGPCLALHTFASGVYLVCIPPPKKSVYQEDTRYTQEESLSPMYTNDLERRRPPPPLGSLSAQISATTKRGCRPWAGSPWGPGNRGADLLLPPPPPQQKWGRTESRPSTPPPPPACLRTLTAGRHMVIEVPQGADAERRV